MERYELSETDKKLIEIGLEVLKNGQLIKVTARDLLPFARQPIIC